MEQYKIIKNYRNQKEYRTSFNDLAKKTFGIDFENWYQTGYWKENYNPYSILFDGKVIANVSVNTTDFIWNGRKKHFIQLGTVMTEEKYRNQGLIRRIMEEIEKDYGQSTEGMYLFANDSVIDFYPKFAFQKAEEYQYTKTVSIRTRKTIDQIPMKEKGSWQTLEKAIKESTCQSSFEMTNNTGLIMFYVTQLMQENVYYHKEQNAYIIAEQEEEQLLIHAVFSPNKINLEQLIEAFGSKVKKVILGFTPLDTAGYTVSPIKEEDTTLFTKGKGLESFSTHKIMFPTLSHA